MVLSLMVVRCRFGEAPLSKESATSVPQNKLAPFLLILIPMRKNPTENRSTQVLSIARAVVIKDDDLFFLCEPNGQVPLESGHGLGLYYHDCRFLRGYELKLGGVPLNALLSTGRDGFRSDFVFGNDDFRTAAGRTVGKEELGIQWERVLDASRLALFDQIVIRNYSMHPVDAVLSLRFRAGFEDVFTVRGVRSSLRGRLHKPHWREDALYLRYDGRDGIHRSLTIRFSEKPDKAEGAAVQFPMELPARQSKTLVVSLIVAERRAEERGEHTTSLAPDYPQLVREKRRAYDDWLNQQTQVRSRSVSLQRVLERSLRDLRTLRSTLHGHAYFAAGVPWYVTLFGRDSITAALQTLAYEPDVAAKTLRLLARFQGTKEDEQRDEQPGKIPHELRVGELAHCGKIAQTPYYGTIDATPLFVLLLCQHAAWTGDLSLFHELRDNIERALAWMNDYGDPEGWGYLSYQCKAKQGLANQGWKDSGDAIMNADGRLAEPPIALVEVQGYVYMVKRGLADLLERDGQAERATGLRREADELRQRFNRDFWLEDKGIYALALQKDKKPAAVVASNAGQALWARIADEDKARRTIERLMTEDMFNGWGIRTLSSKEVRYNPLAYQLGSIWPHDNSIIVAGLRAYGADEAACRIFRGIIEAALDFHADRLPEVFAGYEKERFGWPVRYPVACHPQAWAAGAVPFMLQTLLGLIPEAFERRLRIVRPVLPPRVNDVELRGLRVGSARVDVRFERRKDERSAVEVLGTKGEVEVIVED